MLEIPKILQLYALERQYISTGLRFKYGSPIQANPGDISTFSYKKESGLSPRMVLIIKTDYHPFGKFISTKNKLLICCFDITDVSPATLDLVFDLLYKKRSLCSYRHSPKVISYILGPNNFKTFEIPKIINYNQVELHG